MSDDLLTRMRSASSLGAAIKALDEGADEIESLRSLLAEGRDLMQEHANEIDRLRTLLREASGAKTWGDAQAYIDAALGERHE